MIKNILKAAVIATVAFGISNTAFAAQAVSLDELLEQVKIGRVKDADENKKRIAEFQAARGRQQELISREIQTAYQMGKQAQLRVLLNQEDPANRELVED